MEIQGKELNPSGKFPVPAGLWDLCSWGGIDKEGEFTPDFWGFVKGKFRSNSLEKLLGVFALAPKTSLRIPSVNPPGLGRNWD